MKANPWINEQEKEVTKATTAIGMFFKPFAFNKPTTKNKRISSGK